MLQVTLFIGPYKFRKRAVRKNGVVQFTCCSCESEAGSVVSAYAEEILKEDGSSSYILNSYPSHSEHLCIRNGFENYIECLLKHLPINQLFCHSDETTERLRGGKQRTHLSLSSLILQFSLILHKLKL